MELQQQFEAAVAASKTLAEKPDNATLLRLYGLYKQATQGDAGPDGPDNPFDIVGKAKYEAWAELRGQTKDGAMQEYVALVGALNSER